jgi:hypothetical protein
MFCTIKSPEQRRWMRSCWISSALLVLLAVGAAEAFRLWHLKGLPAYSVAALPALPILWFLVEMGRFLAVEKDEFQRNILVQCVLGGTWGSSRHDNGVGVSGRLCPRPAPRSDLGFTDLLAVRCGVVSAGQAEVQMKNRLKVLQMQEAIILMRKGTAYV